MAQARKTSSDVVGRESELRRLESFAQRVADGERAVLVVSGMAGIGKTTLYEEGIRRARTLGVDVLVARPTEPERHLSFSGLTDLLGGIDLDACELPSPLRLALDVALLRVEPPTTSPTTPRAVSAASYNVLRDLAERTRLLVAIDDVQWLDDASAAALAYAARRLEDASVSFLLAHRTGTRASFLETSRLDGLDVLALDALSFGAIRHIVAEHVGLRLARRVERRLFDMTAGNPFFALEVARALRAHGVRDPGADLPVPDRIEELLGLRLSRVPNRVREVLLAVALAGDYDVAQLERLVDGSAIDAAVAAKLVQVEQGRLRPAHPLLGTAARATGRPVEVRKLHRRLAAAADDPERRARHLALSVTEPDDDVASSIADAARSAASRGAPETAVALAEHALRLTPPSSEARFARLVALAEGLMVTGEHARVRDLIAPIVDRMPPGEERVRARVLLVQSRWVDSHIDETGKELAGALAESARYPALHALLRARWSKYLAIGRVERIAEAAHSAERALPEARVAGAAVERVVLHELAWTRVLQGRPLDDVEERMHAVSRDAPDVLHSYERVAAERLACRGEIARARSTLEGLLEVADHRGDMWSYAVVRLQLCELELRAGAWDEAGRLLHECTTADDGRLLDAAAYDRCRAQLAFGRGDSHEAIRRAEAALADCEPRGLRWNVLEARRVRGMARLLARDPSGAAADLRGVWRHVVCKRVDEPGMFPVQADLVEALVELGEFPEARQAIGRLTTLTAEQAHPWGEATTLRCRSLVELAEDSADGVSAPAEEAAERYEALGLRFDAGRTLLAVGRWQRRLRKRAAARRSLEAASELFEEARSAGWVAVTRAELERLSGRRPGRPGELTPSERRAVALAADGLSNKEIAEQLVVSVHTVEVHLSRAYVKLGIRSRTQLSRALST